MTADIAELRKCILREIRDIYPDPTGEFAPTFDNVVAAIDAALNGADIDNAHAEMMLRAIDAERLVDRQRRILARLWRMSEAWQKSTTDPVLACAEALRSVINQGAA